MAIDTKAKRFSILNWRSGPVIVKPVFDADGSVDEGDRYNVLQLYSGITLDAPTAINQSDPLGASGPAYAFLKAQGYDGGLSTARREFLGVGFVSSQDAYDDLVAEGYDGGISTARRNYTEDNT